MAKVNPPKVQDYLPQISMVVFWIGVAIVILTHLQSGTKAVVALIRTGDGDDA